jgi:hypothetical protein
MNTKLKKQIDDKVIDLLTDFLIWWDYSSYNFIYSEAYDMIAPLAREYKSFNTLGLFTVYPILLLIWGGVVVMLGLVICCIVLFFDLIWLVIQIIGFLIGFLFLNKSKERI